MRPLVLTEDLIGDGCGPDRTWRSATDWLSLARAVTGVGNGNVTIFIDTVQSVPADLSVPANVKLQFNAQGKIQIAAGATLTLDTAEQVIAPVRQQVFECLTEVAKADGAVACTNGGRAYPGWFGAVADGATDDAIAIQRTLNAVAGAGTVVLPIGDYAVDDGVLELPDKTALIGEDMYLSRLIPEYSGDALSDGWTLSCGSAGDDSSDCTLANLSIYCDNNEDGASPITQHGVVGFEKVTRALVHHVYFYNGGGGVQFKNCPNFHIHNIEGRSVRDFLIAFLSSDSKHGTVSDVVAYQCGEVLDFGENEDITVTNVIANGQYPERDQEAIDCGSSKRIHLSHVYCDGDWPNGVVIKAEGDPLVACEDITCEDVRMTGMTGRCFYFQGTGDDNHARLKFLDCFAECDESSASAVCFGDTNTTKIDGLTIRGGHFKSTDACIDFHDSVWTRRVVIDGAIIETDPADTGGIGIYLGNSRYPVIRNCEIPVTGSHAIYVYWNSTNELDDTEYIIGATIDNNRIINPGLAIGTACGIRITLANGIDTGATYNVLRICGNLIFIDENGTRTSRTAIKIEHNDLAAIDYANVSDNSMFRVPTGISFAGAGGNCVQADNVAYVGA